MAAPSHRPKSKLLCQTFPHSIEALDLPTSATLVPTLASVRLVVLDYLADLEKRLAECELLSPAEKGAAEWAQTGMEMLEKIRADVSTYLPDLDYVGLPSLDGMRSRLEDVRTHLPDMPDVRAHLPDMPDVPSFALADLRARLSDFNFSAHRPLSYIPRLSSHLESLHSHLASASSTVPLSTTVLDMLAHLSSTVIPELMEKGKTRIDETEDAVGRAAREIKDAIKRSFDGSKLIQYADLPHQWRNNEFVRGGYRQVSTFRRLDSVREPHVRRFIPLERWPLIILSLFMLHNETRKSVFLPLAALPHRAISQHPHAPHPLPRLAPLPPPLAPAPPPLLRLDARPHILALQPPNHGRARTCLYRVCTVLPVLQRCLAHDERMCTRTRDGALCPGRLRRHRVVRPIILSGPRAFLMILLSRLISASVGTVVYYGFRAHPACSTFFLAFSFVMGVVGSVLPFQAWFNDRAYKNYRIAFFLALAFSAVAPLAGLAWIYSPPAMLKFIGEFPCPCSLRTSVWD